MHTLLPIDDDDYPALLRRLPDAPRALYMRGDAGCLWHPAIAIVGSRTATPNGFDNARGFARAFGRAGFCIISGMAAGIDTAAHRGALDVDAPTVAVLGTGIDTPYPRSNAGLMEEIAQRGAVVSEYPPGAVPHPGQFPARNRIVAGLTLGTVVVEAQQKSGALITARLAGDAGREVFAIPGSIHNPMARGCHRLIREGVQLVESPDEVIAALKPLLDAYAGDLRRRLHAPNSAIAAPQHDSSTMDAGNKRLWEALGHDPTPMDVLVDRTGLTSAQLVSMLLVMELEGRVVSQHGRYTRKAS
ncbi:DNA protecting protein DprA [Lysobacter dokdonensis DS-58]|uniref:DNA protecting protein DprA n=1 Tax=Lysobacter dokdonensis DS-58 TaxID=1300345 RepID=A0A0A2WD02_9GAMM|nr:DNA-processing protein DprA [Lysobacter dokdonensis]KGQ18036.1 DNA protecting protein DprA [Lysobacter dokdonensis DS-58]